MYYLERRGSSERTNTASAKDSSQVTEDSEGFTKMLYS